jgi:chitodextrinase
MISWWSNIATVGSVTIAGRNVTDPAGPLQHHAVTISGLVGDTSYPYTVTSGSVTGTGTLRTAATAGQTFSFAAIGDYGGGSPGELQNANNIGTAGTQFIQTLGDNIYPAAGLPDPDFSTVYSDFDGRFYKQFNPVIKNQTFFPANGNKEYYGDGAFWNNFPMPGSNHSWYSYDWGNAHILVLDSEMAIDPNSAQFAFAQADLVGHQGNTWRIVAIQRPPYSSSSANSSSVPVRQFLVPLFQTQNVDLVLSGNSHNYERTFPLKNDVPVSSGGITYIVSGGGGNGFNTFQLAQPAYSAFREATFSEFVKVTVSPSAITVDGIRSDSNAVFDSTTISKGDATAPTAPTAVTPGTTTATTVPLTWTASTDNVGVTRYDIFRNSALAGSATTTSFTDTGLTPSTTYSYTIKAVDAAGNSSPASAAASATTASGTGGSTVTLPPAADATIDPASATPTASRLKVDASAPINDLLVKFAIPVGCNVATAVLQVTVGNGANDPSARGGDIYATNQSDPNAGWTENSVTWTSAPAASTAIAPVSITGPVTADTTYSADVMSLLRGATGNVTLRASSTSGDGAGYYSKEGSATSGPRLVLTCS